MAEKNISVEFGIREIRELEFFVDEAVPVDSSFDFNYNVDVLLDIKSELLTMVVTVNYFRNPAKALFLKGRISTSFSIKDMKNYARKLDTGGEGMDIPEPLWVTFFSIAFTHARAVLARSSAGSKFMGLLMPVINPQAEFKKLFGEFLKAD